MASSTGEDVNISLIGFMGAGKSTIGRLLAERLGMRFVDLDEEIAAIASMDIPRIFACEGEKGFRAREHAALQAILEDEEGIISCGGGVVLRDDNVELLRDRSLVVYIRITAAKAVQRLHDTDGRPLLDGGVLEDRVADLLAARSHRYDEAAHEVIDAGDLPPETLAEEIARRCRKESG